MRNRPRLVFLAIFLACAMLIGIAITMQEQLGLEPCPMCILQRYAFIAIGVVALVAAIHAPHGVMLRVYAALVVLLAIGGGGTSMRHSYLQHFPPAVETCGTDLEFLLNTFPLAQALPKIFAGSASCSKVDWRMLGLTIPEWAFVWFVLIAIAAAWMGFFAARNRNAARGAAFS
jgi:disulfide bond formation protein DsbB